MLHHFSHERHTLYPQVCGEKEPRSACTNSCLRTAGPRQKLKITARLRGWSRESQVSTGQRGPRVRRLGVVQLAVPHRPVNRAATLDASNNRRSRHPVNDVAAMNAATDCSAEYAWLATEARNFRHQFAPYLKFERWTGGHWVVVADYGWIVSRAAAAYQRARKTLSRPIPL